MKKRIISFLLVLVMTLGFLPTISFADAKIYGDLTYKIYENTITITDCDYRATVIDIPSNIDGYPVTTINDLAFCDCKTITNIIIPSSVTKIGYSAFENCKNLVSISIPDSVTSIGNNAFYGCESLVSITISNNITSIFGSTFSGCTSLKSILIPDNVTEIGNYAFYSCKNLMSITIPDGIHSIGGYAFRNCANLNSVIIGDGVTSIGFGAFLGCSSLISITIPDSVTSIADDSFKDCNRITDVYYGGDRFQWQKLSNRPNADNITIHYAKTEHTFSIGDNLIGTINEISGKLVISGTGNMLDGHSIISDYIKTYIKTIEIQNGVTSIGSYSFSGCASLISIKIPNSVTLIGDGAFAGTNITCITIPDSVISIGNNAFSNCKSLTTIDIPNSVSLIGEKVFYNCKNLTSIKIGNGLQSIGDSFCYNCTSLMNITFPDNVTSIGNNAFYNCRNLASVSIGDSVTSIGSYTFYNCTNLENITIGKGVISIDENAFMNCSNLKSVYIFDVTAWCNIVFSTCLANPMCQGADLYLNDSLVSSVTISNNVNSIGNYAFYGCTSIKSVLISDGITSIGSHTFYNCTSLESVTIGNGIISIDENAFMNCFNLKNVYITDIAAWCEIVFSNIYSNPLCQDVDFYLNDSLITNLTIFDDLTSIGDYAFYNCKSLKTIILPNDVTSIGIDAFMNCIRLTSISMPDGVISIGDGAFRGCKSLASIIIPDSITSIGEYAFYDCNDLKRIELSDNIKTIGYSAFCSSGIKVIYLSKEISTINIRAFDSTNISYVYYGGDEADRQDIRIESYNDSLNDATWNYNATGLPEHEYEDDYDIVCNICGATRKIDHKYDNACDKDCNVCGAVRETAHTFGGYIYNNDASEKADGTKTRTCSICGHKETVTAVGTKWTASFTDIKAKDFYYKPTLWAVANNITTGTSKTAFSPEEPCTRGQVVTFLWRAAGCPEPKTTTMPFTDVGSKAFYRKAVLWAVEQGITSGTSATTFGPNETCTRGQIATFLWRAKAKPAPKSSNMPFVDVAKKDFYYTAVQWAVENKITSGTSKTTFAPSDPCTRGQIVTFLYRAYN